MNHFAKLCHTTNQNKHTTRGLSSADKSDSEETSGRITVGKLDSKSISVKIKIQPFQDHTASAQLFELATDTGVSKTILKRNDWETIKNQCKFVKKSKRFQPFGTAYHLLIRGKAHVNLTAQQGAQIDTYVYIIDNPKEQSLLGEEDAKRLGIVKLKPERATHKVIRPAETIKHISYPTKTNYNSSNKDETSAHETNSRVIINQQMQQILEQSQNFFPIPPENLKVIL